jgi:hypothetical protein
MGNAKEPLEKLVKDDQKIAPAGRNVKKLQEKLIDVALTLPSEILLVFDALDEASLKTRTMIESLLRGLKSDGGPRVLILGRPDVQVPDVANLPEDAVFKVPIEGSGADIHNYIQTSLRNNTDVIRTFKKTFKTDKLLDQAILDLTSDIEVKVNGM